MTLRQPERVGRLPQAEACRPSGSDRADTGTEAAAARLTQSVPGGSLRAAVNRGHLFTASEFQWRPGLNHQWQLGVRARARAMRLAAGGENLMIPGQCHSHRDCVTVRWQ